MPAINGRRAAAAVVALVILVATPAMLHAISAARCARKCTYVTGTCVVQRGSQCFDAVPAAPCLQQLDQQCERESVAACIESSGRHCKKKSCRTWRKLWCKCMTQAFDDDLGPICFAPKRCPMRPDRCATTTTSTTLPPPSARWCCVDFCANGGCMIGGSCTAELGQPCCEGHDQALFIETGTCEAYLSSCTTSCG